ncbi:IS200/IS605 family transposase [Rhodohalobacter sp.]|uniref:IS200/IS605 family transposase n=1 Tax=Rhodohalobacter sp. TaxID=1974210 RepID=UPI002ACE6868|nr:IS200/IS605 family transposase [Rhodohalobacter sp.]MDZ7755405.1 IS200/IS605 family transposase [Rhodohalobacter sp.]
MSWVQVWVHIVFTTKNRKPYLQTPYIRRQVFNHIKTNAKEKEIWLDCVNGYKEHIHCLISLGKDQTLSKITQLIKGESSYWINSRELTDQKFRWQDDYWAVSVSKSHIESLRKYIFNQERHHKKNSFREEIDEFMKKQGWRYLEG